MMRFVVDSVCIVHHSTILSHHVSSKKKGGCLGYTGVIKIHILEDQTKQMYGNFECYVLNSALSRSVIYIYICL